MEVIKIGGAAGVQADALCRDLAGQEGADYLLVHGGSAATNDISIKLGKTPKMFLSPSGHESRYTDAETIEIFTMVCAGKVNKELVQALQQNGINAVGLSGLDGRIVAGKRKKTVRAMENGKIKIIRNDYSGMITDINTKLLEQLLDNGYLPVVGPPAISEEGYAINVDADRMAAAVAVKMQAERLIILSNVPGLLEDPEDEGSLISRIPADRITEYRKYAKGRMGKKLLAAEEAIAGGVNEVILGDAGVCNPVTEARKKKGTVIS